MRNPKLKKLKQQDQSFDTPAKPSQWRKLIEFIAFLVVEYRFILLAFSILIASVFLSALTVQQIRAHLSPSDPIHNNDFVFVSTEDDAVPTASPTPSPSPSPTPSPTPTCTPTPTPDPTLRQGDENDRVRELQERLMDLNYMDLDEATSYFGTATKYAIQLFQRQHELAQDGVAGPKTLDLLFSRDAKKYTLLKGTSGNDVDSLQRQLVDLGYLEKATGYYGTMTVNAVKDFQERNDLTVDGKTGEQTLTLIYSPKAKASASKIQEENRRANIKTFISIAKEQLGDKYVLGAVGPNSFDCSGLVYYCLREAGSSRGRYNALGYSQVTDWEEIKSMNNLEIGDLLFFSTGGKSIGHVGIYIGNGEMIDASSSNGKVVRRSCKTDFWTKNFKGARRPW